jgi:hypothetical protein
MGHWQIRFAGQKRRVSGKDCKKAIAESFKKKPPKILSNLIEVTDLDTKTVSYLSSDVVVKVVR